MRLTGTFVLGTSLCSKNHGWTWHVPFLNGSGGMTRWYSIQRQLLGIPLSKKGYEVQKVFSKLFLRRPSGSHVVREESTFGANCRNQAQRLQREAQVYYFAFKHPRVR